MWVIVITNAVNLIDGLDGLATGIVAIASGALAVYGLRLVDLGQLPADNLGPLIAVVAFGVCIGFLPHNFHPARAFMGDAGALFLGLLMAAATMVIGGRTPDVSGQTYFFFAPLFIPLFILGVPIADMAFAFIRRTAKGTGFHTPDKDHVHHRLLRLGHGPRRTVVILWAWTAVLSGFVLYPLFASKANAVIPFGAVVLGPGRSTPCSIPVCARTSRRSRVTSRTSLRRSRRRRIARRPAGPIRPAAGPRGPISHPVSAAATGEARAPGRATAPTGSQRRRRGSPPDQLPIAIDRRELGARLAAHGAGWDDGVSAGACHWTLAIVADGPGDRRSK